MQFDDAVVRQSKSAFVLARLRESIFAGEFEPGDVLRQNELAARFGVSSTPVREALRGLEAEGLVTMSPRGGATVARFGDDRVDELRELRALVEGYATRLAAEHLRMRRAEEIARLHEQIERQAAAELREPHVLQELDRRFHFMIYETGALIAATTARSLWSYLPTHEPEWADPVAADRLVAEHAGIVAALRAADPELAESRMRAHILPPRHPGSGPGTGPGTDPGDEDG
jgi:DNA-binding GntR family transcriptional regulator